MSTNPGSRKIKTLDGVSIEQIHEAFSSAFSDYTEPFSMSVPQLTYQLERRGYAAALSFGEFEDGLITGFTLNGRGNWEGKATAYDTGTGVRPEYRGQGVASRIFEASLPVLREHGIRQYLLEVIRTNTGAVNLYGKAGFTVSREFDYWTAEPGEVHLAAKGLPADLSIGEIHAPDWGALSRFWDFEPSWQNSIDSVTRKLGHITLLGAWHRGAVVAYACMEKQTGDLPQLAVHPEFRRQGLATALVQQLLDSLNPPEFRVTNTCTEDVPTKAFLSGLGLEPGDGQFEMTLQL